MSIRGGDRLTPFMAKLRDILLRRPYNNSLRYADKCSKRTQPLVFLPNGVNDKLSKNDYCLRDDRRTVHRPTNIFVQSSKMITSGLESQSSGALMKSVDRTPGVKYNWDKYSLQ